MDENSSVLSTTTDLTTDRARRIRLKCKCNGDVRVVILLPDHSFAQLKRRLSLDYGFEVSLKYEDDDGDLIVLSSQNDLDDLVTSHPDRDTINIIVSEAQSPLILPVLSRRDNVGRQQIFPASAGGPSHSRMGNRSGTAMQHDRFPQIDSPVGNQRRDSRRNIRWKRGEVLGQGAFGVVNLGLNVETGELMAVKQIAIDELSNKDLSAIENEIALLKSFRHPNIVRYIGTEVTPVALSIFLEYVPGGSLKTLIEKFGALEESVAKSYTRQLLLGLEYLHRNGVAHRDIKGANCLVGNDGVIKLADFGSSKQWRSSGTPNATTTGNGEMKGTTPSWMAPEIVKDQGSEISWKKADVWSLACTTIEMVTGKPPWSQFNNNSVTILYHIACTEELPEYPNPATDELTSFLNTCLCRDPTNRPDITSLLLHPFVANMGASFWGHTSGGNFAAMNGFVMRPSTVNTSHGDWEQGGMWRRPTMDMPVTRGSLTTASASAAAANANASTSATASASASANTNVMGTVASRVSSSSASSVSGMENKRDGDRDSITSISQIGGEPTTLDKYMAGNVRFQDGNGMLDIADDADVTFRTTKGSHSHAHAHSERSEKEEFMDSPQLQVTRFESINMRAGSFDSENHPEGIVMDSPLHQIDNHETRSSIISMGSNASGLFNMNFENTAAADGDEYPTSVNCGTDLVTHFNDGSRVDLSLINSMQASEGFGSLLEPYDDSAENLQQYLRVPPHVPSPMPLRDAIPDADSQAVSDPETLPSSHGNEGTAGQRRRIKFQLDDELDEYDDEIPPSTSAQGSQKEQRARFDSFGEDSLESIEEGVLAAIAPAERGVHSQMPSQAQSNRSGEASERSIDKILEGRRRGDIVLEPIVGRQPLTAIKDIDTTAAPVKGIAKTRLPGANDPARRSDMQGEISTTAETGSGPGIGPGSGPGIGTDEDYTPSQASSVSGVPAGEDQSEHDQEQEWVRSNSRRASLSSFEGLAPSFNYMSMSGRSSPSNAGLLAPVNLTKRGNPPESLNFARYNSGSLDLTNGPMAGVNRALLSAINSIDSGNGAASANPLLGKEYSISDTMEARKDSILHNPLSPTQMKGVSGSSASSSSISSKLVLGEDSSHSTSSHTKSRNEVSNRSDIKLQKLRLDVDAPLSPQLHITSSTLYSPKNSTNFGKSGVAFQEAGSNLMQGQGELESPVPVRASQHLKTPSTSHKRKEKDKEKEALKLLISGSKSSPPSLRYGSESPSGGVSILDSMVMGFPPPTTGQLRIHGTAAGSRAITTQSSSQHAGFFEDGRSVSEVFRGLQSRYETDSVADDDGSFFAPAARLRQRTAGGGGGGGSVMGGGGGTSSAQGLDSSDHGVVPDTSYTEDKDDGDIFSAPVVLEGHTGPISRLRCPKRSNVLLSSSLDGSVRIWSPNEGRSRMVLDCESFNQQVGENEASGVGKSGGGGGGGGGKHVGSIRVTNMWVQSACDAVYAGCSDGCVRVWGGHDGRAIRILKGHEEGVTAVEGLNPQSSLQPSCLLATGSNDRSVRVWDVRAKKAQAFMFRGHSDAVVALRWSEGGSDEQGREGGGGKILVSGGKDKTIRIWDMRAGRLRATLEKHLGSVTSIRFLPGATTPGSAAGGISFVSGAKDSMIHLWDEMGDCIGAQPGHRGAVTFFSDFNYNFSMVGLSGKHRASKASGVLLSTPYTQSVPMMLSCGADNIVKIWDMKRFRTVSEVAVGSQGGALTKAVWVGPNALVTANGGSIRLWERVPEYLSQSSAQSLDASFMDTSSDAGAVNYVWRSRSLATHAQTCSDILSTEHFIASGSKSGQILYWGN